MNLETFESYLSRLFDRDLSPEEFAELEQYLTNSPEARSRYMELVDLHNLMDLELAVAERPQMGSSSIIPIDLIIHRQKRSTFRIAAFAAAAVLIICLVTMTLFKGQEKPPTLVFETAPGTQSSITHSSKSDDAPTGYTMEKGSRLHISQGTVELTFGTGVKSIVTAPADMTLHDDNKLHLDQGTAWFHVPEGAEGFQVTTHDLDIIDLGTEFGVIATPDDHDEVHVFKGKVEVTALWLRKESATLVAGEARRIDPIGKLDTITNKPKKFLASLPKLLPYLHWSFDGEGSEQLTTQGNLVTASTVKTNVTASGFTSTSGKFGDAITLNSGSSISTNWHGPSGNAARTVAYWINLPRGQSYSHPIVGWGFQVDNYDADTRAFYSYVSTASKKTTTGISCGAYWLDGTTEVADSQWHHIAVVYTGKNKPDGDPDIRCYVDGEREQTIRKSRSMLNFNGRITLDTATEETGSTPLWMFGHPWEIDVRQKTFSRSMDELHIYQGALSDEEINNLFLHNTLSP